MACRRGNYVVIAGEEKIKIKMKQLLVICGPTAVGKTSLALSLAKNINGELVNVDARQVYRGMDIGTGKDRPANSKHEIRNSKVVLKDDNFRIGYYLFDNIPIWLLDIVDPNYRFTVADYLQCAPPVLDNIWQRNRLPIIVGGSGFYLRALLEGIGTIGVKPDWALRKKLACQTVIDLQTMLKKQDELHYNRMNHSDKNNPRRLIRAIEIAHKIKSKTAKNGWQGIEKELKIDKKNILMIGLKRPMSVLDKRIKKRVRMRLKMGLLTEIKRLRREGYGFSNSILSETMAYKEWQEYFNGDEKKGDVIMFWQRNECQLARRQMTWFKKNRKIKWFNIGVADEVKKMEKTVLSWYIKRE